ncbi:amidohydrolase family protein [Helicobacter canis]|uniref:Amidohydrolase family protein n=1 Tax=Helicobacter canis TaxID=29419 RepID=A0A5M9QQP6_9HELI|nr:amidohydrolase family protein [Helicobacter canis]KAA8710032.1 amidohydrolase family protein [Helicobacter canis]
MLLKNALLCDALKECKADLRVDEERGIISEIGENLAPQSAESVLECSGKVILPALIDMAYPKNQVLSRKNLESLTQKALRGGVGSLLLRPESTPRIDHAAIIELVSSLDSSLSVHFLPSLAPTTLESPESKPKIAEIASLIASGARAIYLESSAQNIDGYTLYKIAQYAQMLQVPIIASPQEPSLSEGVMNESQVSAQLGLPAIPPLAQTMQVAKLCELARYSGTRWVFDVISEIESLQTIAHFTQMGAQILAQTSLHHLILSDEHCAAFDTRFKLFPPLKDPATREQLRAHLDSGISLLTCLQSDSYKSKKDQVFEFASFGINALEHYFSLGFSHLVKSGLITLQRFSELTSYAQARLLSLPKGALEVGLDADLIIVDLQESFCVEDTFSPYNGERLSGVVTQVLLGGKIKSL